MNKQKDTVIRPGYAVMIMLEGKRVSVVVTDIVVEAYVSGYKTSVVFMAPFVNRDGYWCRSMFVNDFVNAMMAARTEED